MENKIRGAFAPVRADEALLAGTAAFLRRERARRQSRFKGPAAYRGLAAVLAAALLLVAGIGGYRWYRLPGAYVSIDVNPSVELTINRMDRVVGSYAFNAQGAQILAAVDLQGKPSGEAVELFLAAVGAQGYLTDGSLVALSVQTAADREAALGDTLALAARRQLEAHHIAAEVEVVAVPGELREEAHGCHMSPAKYLAIQELLAVDDQATLEGYSHHSIQQIRDRTRACRDEPAGGGHGRGNGHAGAQGNRNGGHGH